MASITFDRNGTKVGLAIAMMSGRLEAESARIVLEAAEHVAGTIREVVYDKFPEGRTGALGRSFKPVFLGRDDHGVSAAASSDLVYARIQDEGGTVVPKTTKALAIPLKRLPVGKWPRHFAKGELTLIPGKNGKASILAKVSKGGKVDPMFVLVRSVRIPGRHYLDAAAELAGPGVEEIMSQGYARAIDKNLDGEGQSDG